MNEITAVSVTEHDPEERTGSVSTGRASLSPLQRDFALQFVATGGKGRRAAILAGYAAPSAHVAASRNLCNPRCLAEIDRLCRHNIKAALPVAIRTLIDVCMRSKDDKARVMAANSLLDRSGLAAPKGGVQVNVGVQVNGGQAQRLIAEVWEARAGRMSDIPASMPDNLQALSDAIDALEAEPDPAEGEGGEALQGPAPPVPTLPPYSPATPASTSGPISDPEKLAQWRDATGEEE